MKIFLSWSGERSCQVANLFKNFIKIVIQASKPFVSNKDIKSGARWSQVLGDELSKTSTGIIFITHGNKDAPWLLFEAGVLSKSLEESNVCTLLIDMKPADLKEPLAQFHHTLVNEDNIYKLCCDLNNLLDDKLDAEILKLGFNQQWPIFKSKYDEILLEYPDTEKPIQRDTNDILSEILENTRHFDRRLHALENIKVPLSGFFKSPIEGSTTLSEMASQNKNDQFWEMVRKTL